MKHSTSKQWKAQEGCNFEPQSERIRFQTVSGSSGNEFEHSTTSQHYVLSSSSWSGRHDLSRSTACSSATSCSALVSHLGKVSGAEATFMPLGKLLCSSCMRSRDSSSAAGAASGKVFTMLIFTLGCYFRPYVHRLEALGAEMPRAGANFRRITACSFLQLWCLRSFSFWKRYCASVASWTSGTEEIPPYALTLGLA